MLNTLKKIHASFNQKRFLCNVLNSRHKKSVLISYITHPFKDKKSNAHTNIQESIAIAKSFDELGYNCDVANFNSNKKIDYTKYDVIFGFGEVFEKSFDTTHKVKRIYYGTGRHPYFSNLQTIKRGLELQEKRGIFLKESLRLVPEDYALQTTAVDALVLLGNDGVIDTYRKYTTRPCHSLNVSFIRTLDPDEIIRNKDFSKAKKHFLFFSGGGMVHKGLDILLDIFSSRPDLHLHICTHLQAENRFVEIFSKELKELDNIHCYDFIALDSPVFKGLLETCAFVILPSCSEGMPTSVVNVCANGGLIPIVPKVSSIDIDPLSIIIDSISLGDTKKAIDISQRISEARLKTNSVEIAKNIAERYNLDVFHIRIKTIISTILK